MDAAIIKNQWNRKETWKIQEEPEKHGAILMIQRISVWKKYTGV